MVLLGLGLGATGGLLLLKRHVVLGGASLLAGAFLGVRGQEMRVGNQASAEDGKGTAAPAKRDAGVADTNGKEGASASSSSPAAKKGGTSPKKGGTSKVSAKKGGTSKASPGKREDDLQEVKGIGPKTLGVLNAAGIYTFAELAATEVERLKEIVQEANLRLANPEGWPEQAEALAKG
jgi:predicted flap endonuclease-1-like 5' DNA nuclease